MKRIQFVLLLNLIVVLISCGIIQPAAKQRGPNIHPVHIQTKQIDPCKLVNQAQVDQILKLQVSIAQQPAISNNGLIQDLACSYFSSDLSTSAEISLEIYKDVSTARVAFEDHEHHVNIVLVVNGDDPPGNINVTHQTISGLGDQAILIVTPQYPMLFVRKDNVILLITVNNSGQPVSLGEQQEQQLALLAVRNLKLY